MQAKIEPKVILVLMLDNNNINIVIYNERNTRRFTNYSNWYIKK